MAGLHGRRRTEFVNVGGAGGRAVKAGLDTVAGGLDFGEGKVCKEVGSGAVEMGEERREIEDAPTSVTTPVTSKPEV